MRTDADVHQTFGVLHLGLFSLCHCYCLGEHLQIHLIADCLHVTVLLCAQDVACTADFQIAHGDAEARTKGGKLPDGFQSLGSNVGQRLALGHRQVGKRSSA